MRSCLRRIKSYLSIHRFSTAGIDGIKLTIYVIHAMIYKLGNASTKYNYEDRTHNSPF
jgi:hypothetical protein